jgi:hypothetical protein
VTVKADKEPGKSKKAPKLGAPDKSGSAASTTRTVGANRAASTASVASLQTERDQLKAELVAAKLRIEALEAANTQVLNRIAWMIDSLQTLKDGVKP